MGAIRNRFRTWFVWLALLGLMLVATSFVFRAPLLRALAAAWMVSDPVASADAIVVLGGGLENRPFAAAKLFHAGTAAHILFMDVQRSPAEELGVVGAESELTRRVLLSNNVPASALIQIGTAVGSTFDEANAVLDWVLQSGAKTIVIPTDIFHTRRVRWVFARQFRDLPCKIHVQAIDPVRYRATNWWQHEEGLIAFQNEVLKYAYYRLKY